jgi:hypothetical protein
VPCPASPPISPVYNDYISVRNESAVAGALPNLGPYKYVNHSARHSLGQFHKIVSKHLTKTGDVVESVRIEFHNCREVRILVAKRLEKSAATSFCRRRNKPCNVNGPSLVGNTGPKTHDATPNAERPVVPV